MTIQRKTRIPRKRAKPRARRKDRAEALGDRKCRRCGAPITRKPNEQLSGSFRKRVFCGKPCSGKATTRKHSLAKGGPAKIQLDKWFSMIVRSVGECVRCGAISGLQCAHIISRRYLGVRFSLDNALCLCASCHMFFTYRPLEWDRYITDRIGEQAFLDL